MAITLADAALNTVADVDLAVIDEFRKSSWLLDNLTFDDCVNPVGGGATLSYSYTRLTVERSATFRAVNTEYTPAQATRVRVTNDLKQLGGSFQVDRVLANVGPAATNEVTFQMGQVIKSTKTKFLNEIINGDVASVAAGFDGLDKALTGSSTELFPGGAAKYVDWTNATITSEVAAQIALDLLDEFLALMDETPTALLGNSKSIGRVKSLARRAGFYSRDRNDFGQQVERYGDIVLIDLGAGPATVNPIIPIATRDPDGAGVGGNITGLSDLYAVRLGLDGFHGVSTVGGNLVTVMLPDFTTAGAVKTGEVEMGPVTTALKATKAAAVLRNLKVQ